MTRWKDPANQAALAELSAAGISAGKIAAASGESRQAVNSAMHRYGLHADPRPRGQAQQSAAGNKR
jgi:hypothetical protein